MQGSEHCEERHEGSSQGDRAQMVAEYSIERTADRLVVVVLVKVPNTG